MIDPKKLLNELLAARVPGTESTVRDSAGEAARLARENPIASGAIALALLGTAPGRAIAGAVMRLGGLAAVAGLAYKAYQNYQKGASADESAARQPETELLAPPEGSAFDPATAPNGENHFALALIRAMLAAANADGHIDEQERSRISDRLRQAGIDEESGEFLRQELANPLDLDALAATAHSDPQKVELYTASRIVLEPNTDVERQYLERLAERLGLPEALVEHIEATVSAAR